MQDERSSRQLLTAFHVHIASPNDLRYFKGPYSPKTAKEPKPTMTLAEQVNIVNKRIKTTDHPCFCHKIALYYYEKHIFYLSRSFSLTVCTHVNIRANVVSTTLRILSET